MKNQIFKPYYPQKKETVSDIRAIKIIEYLSKQNPFLLVVISSVKDFYFD